MAIEVADRSRRAAVGLVVALVAGLAGCGTDHPPITTCEPEHGIVPDCRFQNPEDLAASPGGRHLIVSQFAGMEGAGQGSLVALDLDSGRIETLFSLAREPDVEAAERWGDPACPPPTAFSPHGIDLEQLDSGAQALYVVNHGDRESVEMFEVRDDGGRTLTWRGCVLAPDEAFFNDLVVLRDGGFWVSHMYPREASVLWTVLRMQLTGHRPGFVYGWNREDGFAPLPGTDTAFANGVEKSPDERYLFVNSYFGDAVLKVDVPRGEVVASAEVASPDNLTWAPDGRLLAASHHASIADLLACQELPADESCAFRFQVVAIDPASMATEVLLDHAGPPMGAATVALAHGDALWLGTFAGDRIGRVPERALRR